MSRTFPWVRKDVPVRYCTVAGAGRPERRKVKNKI